MLFTLYEKTELYKGFLGLKDEKACYGCCVIAVNVGFRLF